MMILVQNRRPNGEICPRGRLILISLVLLIVAACSPNGAHTTDKKGQSDKILQTQDHDKPNHWKRIIVRLKVTDLDKLQSQAARQKDSAKARAMDQEIARRITSVADRVLKQVEPAGARLVRRYDTLPLLALHASPRAMAILESMPEVLAIQADRVTPPAR